MTDKPSFYTHQQKAPALVFYGRGGNLPALLDLAVQILPEQA